MDLENDSSSSTHQLSSCNPCSLRSSASPSHPSKTTTEFFLKKRNAGRKKFKETRHPIYKGVRRKSQNKWVSEVREPKKKSRIWLGTFPTPEMAARAYDVATLALRGDQFASLNFPDSAWMLPRPMTSSATDIKRAALCAATQASSSSTSIESSDISSRKSEENVLKHSSTGDNTRSAECYEKGTVDDDDEVPYSVPSPAATLFLDEEALFDMPVLLASMAEGLIITPPALHTEYNCRDEMGCVMDLTLWEDQ